MPPVPAVPDTRPLTARVDDAFGSSGLVTRALEGFEPRASQRRLAAQVAGTFEGGGTLVAEAGTGIGKTLAYLVPAVLSGHRVLVSTGTRTLQDQIVQKDVPGLARALGRPIRVACMKGRTNYLCRHRFARLREAASGLPVTERGWLERIDAWASTTATGDRAEIDGLPDEFPFWAELSATADQCLGRECPAFGDCFVARMRDRAAEAELVIVNHHLLCADAAVRQQAFGEVIPECEMLVVDEAHQLEDVVTQYFGVHLSTFRIDELARDAQPLIATLERERQGAADGIDAAIAGVQQVGRIFFEALREQLPRGGTTDRRLFTAEMAARIESDAVLLRGALDRLLARGAAMAPSPDVQTITSRAAALRADLDTLLAVADAGYVHFIETRGRGVFLRAAPIDAAPIVREFVIGRRHATVLVSATLTVDGSFEYALGRLGLSDAATLRLPSEFDYRTQAVLYLPADLPDPRSPGYNRAAADRIADLLELSDGRAFVLFTSYSAMREVRDALTPRTRWPLLVQGTAPRAVLLRDFRTTPHAVLLATASFWQGVDVAGDALSAVIIDRLPFASPTDPLVAARIQAVEARGGHPFGDYQIPLATLTLLQGLGRLIRTRTDRGMLSVLDPRLTRMAYGRRFLASMPGAPVTADLADVARFFGRVRSDAEDDTAAAAAADGVD